MFWLALAPAVRSRCRSTFGFLPSARSRRGDRVPSRDTSGSPGASLPPFGLTSRSRPRSSASLYAFALGLAWRAAVSLNAISPALLRERNCAAGTDPEGSRPCSGPGVTVPSKVPASESGLDGRKEEKPEKIGLSERIRIGEMAWDGVGRSLWCPGEDSNLHGGYPLVPETSASTNSATWAGGKAAQCTQGLGELSIEQATGKIRAP
jgi:hypothetical protein